jgi:hypothetical protein
LGAVWDGTGGNADEPTECSAEGGIRDHQQRRRIAQVSFQRHSGEVVQGGRARDTFPKHTSDVSERGCGSDESEGRPEGKYYLGREVHKESRGNVGCAEISNS